MFNNKEEFKSEFQKRCITVYGNEMSKCHITELYDVLGTMVRDYVATNWKASKDYVRQHEDRQLVYFSMEFLIGRLLVNNLQNLGIYHVVKDGLKDLGINIHDIEEQESDAGLGNGGLGRLAACFLDSIASLGYPGHGNCIRYEYGFFKQKIVDGKQVEVPDQWLNNGFAFEVRKPKHSVEVQFGGEQVSYAKQDGSYGLKTVNSVHVKAVPYDVSVIGYRNKVVDTLRLWSAEPSEKNLPKNESFEDYLNTLKALSHGLYPDDSTETGRLLRVRQQYFLVSSGLQSILRGHFRKYKTLLNLPNYYVIQLNDTHPILAIPELMRIMMDMYGFGCDESWEVVQKCFAYTNHTIMAEALEKWPVNFIRQVCPRCLMIIEEIQLRFNAYLN
jgi:starch phosphorylase